MEVKIIVPKFPNGIAIGEERENLAVPVVVDYTAWIEQHGAGALQILLQRPQDADPYPVTVTNDNGEAVWTPNETDMNFKGRGEIQLVYTAGGVIERSPVIMVISGRSLVAAGDPPDPFETWLEELTELAAETLVNAQSAEDSASEANADALRAAQSALDADAAKTGAETASTTAGQSATLAGEKAAQAAQSAQTAAQKATDAQQSAEDAQAASSAAQTAASAAAASASAAAGSAADAASAVTEVETKGAEQIAAINQAGATQIAAVDAAGAAQVQAIEDRGEEVIASIPSDYTELVDEVSDLKSSISQKAPVIINTASGDIASFADGADGMPMKIVGTIVPQQSGTGNPSPTNVRPISGWTGAVIGHAAERIFNNVALAQGGISSTTGATTVTSGRRIRTAYIPIKPNTKYKVYTNVLYTWFYEYNGATIDGYEQTCFEWQQSGFEITTESWTTYLKLAFAYSTSSSSGPYISITDLLYCNIFEVGKGDQISINWQSEAGTIYGGTVTLNEDGSADVYVPIYGYHIMPSQWTWQATSYCWKIDRASLTPRYKYYGDGADAKYKVLACDKYVPFKFNYQANYSVAIREYNAQWLALKTNGTNTVTPEECTILLELQTPLTYHFENIGQLYTYLGTNNVWIDTGSISECDYPADTKLYIDGLTEPDEDMIADANIASGKYFVVNNQLYLSTAAIAAGASIVPGTNCTATNLAEALNALNT